MTARCHSQVPQNLIQAVVEANPTRRLARFTPRMSYLPLDEGAIDDTVPLALEHLAAAFNTCEPAGVVAEAVSRGGNR